MAENNNAVPPKSIGHYVLIKTIGEGTFGTVKLGTHILTGERVAVKVLEKERIVEVADVERVAREIHILKLIKKSRHIIQLYEIIETPRQLYLIMEYAPGGELFDYIVEHGRADEREACRFLHQILAGVERVHEMCVVHRDLKPENLLLTEAKDIKIVDFGLSNTHKEGQLLQTACGSPCYAAPEMIANQKYVPSLVDIWSCGVILFALVCGYLPFEDENHVELYRKICSAEYEMPNFVSPEVAHLIQRMLTTDPTQRITLDGIRQHPWYRQIPESCLREFGDEIVLEEPILEQLDCYGFAREESVKCLKANNHNHLTTTYYLLKERRLRESGDKLDCEKAVRELEATCAEDTIYGPTPFDSAVGAVATPSRRGNGWPSDVNSSERPHSARGPHNGARTEPRGRPSSARGPGPGGRPQRGHDTSAPPTARSSGGGKRGQGSGRGRGRPPHSGGGGADFGSDSIQVYCRSNMTGKRVVREVIASLRNLGTDYRQVSAFTIRCQEGYVRIQFDVLQMDRGGGLLLRVSRVSGDDAEWKDLTSRLLNGMDV